MLIIGLLKIQFMYFTIHSNSIRSLFGILQAFLQNLKGTPVKTTTLGRKKEGSKYIYGRASSVF